MTAIEDAPARWTRLDQDLRTSPAGIAWHSCQSEPELTCPVLGFRCHDARLRLSVLKGSIQQFGVVSACKLLIFSELPVCWTRKFVSLVSKKFPISVAVPWIPQRSLVSLPIALGGPLQDGSTGGICCAAQGV
jgi:hypothetical protein